MPDSPAAAPVAAKSVPQPATPGATPPSGTTAPVKPGTPGGQSPPQVAAPDPAKATAERDAAALARARRVEASTREAEKRIKDEQAKFAEERKHHSEALAKAAEYDRLQAAKADPIKAMEALGFTPQQILERIAKGDPAKTPEEVAKVIVDKTLAERDAKAKAEADEARKQADARAQQQAGQQYKAAQDKLASLIKADPDKYEFCNAQPGAAKMAWDLVEDYWKATEAEGRPELLPFEEALQELEDDLQAKHLTLSSTSKKLKALAEAEAAAKKKKAEEEAAAAGAAKKGQRESRPMTGFKTPPTPPAAAASSAPSEVTVAPPKASTPADYSFRVSARKARIAAWREKQRPNDA